ncbi:MAG TPA: GAF domain-containing sensor histidine kinase [Bryobacteraceae bacterium]|nr:GAF domain-containing sensor histidine kinase [Bryobacteraceae bacterium]
METVFRLPAGAAAGQEPARSQLLHLARLLQPCAAELDAAFLRRLGGYGVLEQKALLALTPAAAGRVLSSRGSFTDFLEQVEYNGRRLAKLNLAPVEILRVLRTYDRLVARRRPGAWAAYQTIREPFHLAVTLALGNAFYQVREAETQAFYGLFHAELQARGLDDLLQRFVAILTRTFRARAGRLWIYPPNGGGLDRHLLRRLARPRYLTAGRHETLLLDPGLRGRFASYWSIPLLSRGRLAGLVQFGFATPYRWLPRELQLLDAVADRCLLAAEKARLHEQLVVREAQVRRLAGNMVRIEEEERRRISRELHDDTGQSMLTLRLQLEMLEKTASGAMRQRLGEARQLVESTIAEVRRIISRLSPAVLDQLGLPAAVRQLAQRLRSSCPVQLRLRVETPPQRLPREIETVAYRLVQEAFQNIARHACASRVNLSLRSTDKHLELRIRDNGVGFEIGSGAGKPNSFGLAGMRERVALCGGDLRIVSRPGRGTLVSITLPLTLSSRRIATHEQDSSASRG